jgi:hypothetical protein
MFPHPNIHKYTCTSPDGKTKNQTDYTFIERRRHLSILNVQSSSRADCDTHQYLVVANARERLAINKEAAQKFDVEGFNLRKLSELEVRKQYEIKNSNRNAALENLNDSKDKNKA